MTDGPEGGGARQGASGWGGVGRGRGGTPPGPFCRSGDSGPFRRTIRGPFRFSGGGDGQVTRVIPESVGACRWPPRGGSS